MVLMDVSRVRLMPDETIRQQLLGHKPALIGLMHSTARVV
jgi:hypothetical protein